MRIQHHELPSPTGGAAGYRGVRGTDRIKLLVSVIDPGECAAFPFWPDYLDIKNPADGSLGMPALGTVREVRAIVGTGIPLSVAIGDASGDAAPYGERAVEVMKAGADIVKVGLFSHTEPRSAGKFLEGVMGHASSSGIALKLVAAIYADRTSEWFLEMFPAIASAAGAWGCLLDTYEKKGKRLVEILEERALSKFTAGCLGHGLTSALAGGLTADDIPYLSLVRPDVVGFRSAVVRASRGDAGIDGEKFRRVSSALEILKGDLTVSGE